MLLALVMMVGKSPTQVDTRSQMLLYSVFVSSGTLWRGVNTTIWWGEAGIPPTVSEVLADCSLRLAVAPMIEIWGRLIGKPDSS
jgi:hypothetical protein